MKIDFKKNLIGFKPIFCYFLGPCPLVARLGEQTQPGSSEELPSPRGWCGPYTWVHLGVLLTPCSELCPAVTPLSCL